MLSDSLNSRVRDYLNSDLRVAPRPKWKSIYAQCQSADRSWRNVFYRHYGRCLCLIYLRGFGAPAHIRSELEWPLVPSFGVCGDQLHEQFRICCLRGARVVVGCILCGRLVAAKGSSHEQSALETALNEPAICGPGAVTILSLASLQQQPATSPISKRSASSDAY